MKRIRTALISLALLAGCSVQTGTETTTIDGTAANVAAGAGEGGECCGGAEATGGDCCGAPTKAAAMAEKKADGCGDGCCGACAPEAEAKLPQ
jgi:hypothetical protein